jgi:hypothetical protein
MFLLSHSYRGGLRGHDSGPQFIKRDIKGKKVLSREEQQQSIRHELNFPRITKERSDEEVQEYDFNKSNWMDVDLKIPAKDRDLNPEDVGREQFPDEFYCSVRMFITTDVVSSNFDQGEVYNIM